LIDFVCLNFGPTHPSADLCAYHWFIEQFHCASSLVS
jgi:hypothetical protein